MDAGTFTVLGRYVPGGSDPFDADSDIVDVTVTKAVPGLSLTQSSPTSVEGGPVTFTTTVTGVTTPGAKAPTGEVQFYDGDTPSGSRCPWSTGRPPSPCPT